MTYNPFNHGWVYNPFPFYTFFQPQYLYPTFDSLSTLKPLVQDEFSPNIHSNEFQIFLSPQIKNNENGSNGITATDQVQHDQIKKSVGKKFKKKGRNVQKQLESAKKNCESNLVNQFLSYFSSITNSSPSIIKALKKMQFKGESIENPMFEQIIVFFCRQVSIVNSRKERKYVNRAFLQNYYLPEKLEKYMPDIIQNIEKSDILTKNQFCELFRRCSFHFFRTISCCSVASSAKLNPISRPEHIKRRRLIVQGLTNK